MVRRVGFAGAVVALFVFGVAPAFGSGPYLAGTGASVPLATPVVGSSAAYLDSLGTEFWLAFPSNYSGSPQLSLFISGPQDTTGSVAVPGIGFTTSFTVTANQVTTVAIPPAAQLSGSDAVSNRGIHVTAAQEVAVYGLNRSQATTDAYLGLPVDILGTDYLNLGYKNVNIVNGSEFAIVAVQDGTTVTIIPSVTTGSHPAGTAYTVALNTGQTYQLVNTNAAPADLTGSSISADKPIAVFGGHRCANIPSGGTYACDHIVEQMTPTNTWGQHFAAMPLKTRTGGDTFRVLASTANTQVTINGALVATLQRGQFYEAVLTGPSEISADQPVAVAQYSNGTTYDGAISDPFEMLIAPVEQFLADYAVSTPASGFRANYINVVVPSDSTGSIMLDGSPVASSAFVPIGQSGYSGAQLAVALGSHTLTGSKPFGTFVYGYDQADSYGYPGGMAVRPLCGEDGLDALHDTPLNGVVTGIIHGSVEPAVGGVSPEVAGVVHDVNCQALVPVEGALGG